MPTEAPLSTEFGTEIKKTNTPEPEQPKKRTPLNLDDSSSNKDKKNTMDPMAELMERLQHSVEHLNKSVEQITGITAAKNYAESLVDRAFSSLDSTSSKQTIDDTQNSEKPQTQTNPFNLSPMSDALNTDSILDNLRLGAKPVHADPEQEEKPVLESDNLFSMS